MKRIKKVSQTVPTSAQVVDGHSTSTTDSYSCNYINNLIYPVGSIYLSVNSTNPSTLFGGTWEQIKDKFLLCAGDTYSAGSTGGNATHSHTSGSLTAKIKNYDTAVYLKQSANSDFWEANAFVRGTEEKSASQQLNSGTEILGSTDSSSNMPPYLAVYVWKRTA